MAKPNQPDARPLFLGIEGGGTRSVALMVDARGGAVLRLEAGPANLRLLDDDRLAGLFSFFAAEFQKPDALAIGLAGVRSQADRKRIQACAQRAWPGVFCRATHDLDTALAAAQLEAGETDATLVLIVSGTGSCCYGRNAEGRTVRAGGWGHLLGDNGSGYQIGLQSLRAAVRHFDQSGKWSLMGARILRRLKLADPDDLISWVQSATKDQVGAFAAEGLAAWRRGDPAARQIVDCAIEDLSSDALTCARRLARAKSPVRFVLTGGVLLNDPRFSRRLALALKDKCPGAEVVPLKKEGVWGAIELARQSWPGRHSTVRSTPTPPAANPAAQAPSGNWAVQSPTEQRNPRSSHLDRLKVSQAIELMLSEDARIPDALRSQRREIEKAVKWIARALRTGGRLLYVGAGTSGRLGVLDASECPPTFRTPPDLVQGIIAGGLSALWRSVEGAEDDAEAGARDLESRGVTRRDVVIGIAASGRTPYVWGALGEARRRRARTILLCFNPHLRVPRSLRPNLVIAPDVGPEILTGSTRLKAGTATKLVLNMFTTLAMVQLGKVAGNLMVDLRPTNQKLRERAVRMVRELCGVDEPTARRALEREDWQVKLACARLGLPS